MKEIWVNYQNDQNLIKYLPSCEDNKFPPRDFFYSILSTIKENEFQKLLDEVMIKREDYMKESNKII